MFVVMTVALAIVGSHYQSALALRSLPYTPRASSLEGLPVSSQNSDASRNHDGLCLTPGCFNAAAQLIDNMNTTVDPCEDFYQFACGSWIERHIPSSYLESNTELKLLEGLNEARLRHIVEKPVDEARDPPFVVNLKNFYQSCVNREKLDALGKKPLEEVLQYLGGWPVVEGKRWNESAFDWVETVGKLRELGFQHDIIFKLGIIPDDRNKTRNLLSLDENYRTLHSFLWATEYFKKMTEAAIFLGADPKLNLRKYIVNAYLFEDYLSGYYDYYKKTGNASTLNKRMTLGELKEFAPSISWDNYFNKLLVDPVSDDQEIIVHVPAFVKQVEILLKNTDKRTLATYLIWRVVLDEDWSLGRAYHEHWDLKDALNIHDCTRKLTIAMNVAVSNVFAKNYFPQSSKDAVLTMVKYIKNAFSEILQDISWMDPQTRQRAKEKAEAIVPHIGYPSELLNETLLTKYYENVSYSADNFFVNNRNLVKFHVDSEYRMLRKPNVKVERVMRNDYQLADIEPSYNVEENSVEIAMAMLQGIFFGKDRPNYLNFGAAGVVIAHESTRAFYDKGRQYDKDGHKEDLWNHETEERYKERAQCLIDRFSFREPEFRHPIRGDVNLNGNIADIGGFKAAFRAYLQWEKDNGPEGTLPGLNYTTHQLFWISAANSYCESHKHEYSKVFSQEPYSPSKYRINLTISDLPEFAEAFSCPLGSSMNPEHKCNFW